MFLKIVYKNLVFGVINFSATEAQARVGSANATSGGTIYRSVYLRIHAKYDTVTKDYDIAVMRTEKKMNLDGVKTKAITLVVRKIVISSGSAVTVSGWGRIAVSFFFATAFY